MSDTTNQGSRPMPDFVKAGIIVTKEGTQYLKCAFRVMWMRHEHPGWAIIPSIEYANYAEGFVVMKCVILDDEGRILATAHSEESRGRLPYLKKAETGAIARALGLCGYGTQNGELDEEDFADSPQARGSARPPRSIGERNSPPRSAATPITMAGQVNTSGAQCPSCHAPATKKHSASCKLPVPKEAQPADA